MYVVGVGNTHIAIGTSALAVSANAIVNMIYHKREGHVKLKEGIIFAIPGAIGTLFGTQLGLLTPPDNLLVLFAVFMIAISIMMLRTESKESSNDNNNHDNKNKNDNSNNDESKRLFKAGRQGNNDSNTINNIYSFLLDKKRVIPTGFLVGIAAGYFGIGGGFLIVPALMYSGLNITDAIGTSLLSVSAFGLVTAGRYSIEGHINWIIASLFAIGGVAGGLIGTRVSSKAPKQTIKKVFAILLIVTAIYIILKSSILS